MKHGLTIGQSGIAGAQSIRRAMDVTRAVAQLQRSGASLSRVAHAAGLNQSTAFRILRSLCEERMLLFNERDRSYHLGLLAFELGLATRSDSQVLGHWQPVVEHVAERTRLTTYLMAQSDFEAVCLLCQQGSMAIRAMPMVVGQRLPLGIGAGSLAILATLDDAEVEQVIAEQMKHYQLYPQGAGQPDQIRDRVRAARENGFAMTSGTVAKGLSGIGVSVLPKQGLLQLAISVSAVVDQFNLAEAQQIAEIITIAIKRAKAATSATMLSTPDRVS
jgi:DNA-binding IclR family transcriptional regulator